MANEGFRAVDSQILKSQEETTGVRGQVIPGQGKSKGGQLGRGEGEEGEVHGVAHIVLEDFSDGAIFRHVSSWRGRPMSVDVAHLIRGDT